MCEMDISCATIQYNMDKGRKLSYNYRLILNDIDTSDSTAFFIIRQCFEIWSRVTRYQVSRISSSDFFFMDIFDASVAANRFAISAPTSFSKVLLPDI